MATDEVQGATWERPDDMTAAEFDKGFAAFSTSPVVTQLSRLAYGEDHPGEVEPFGMTTWWTLGQLVAQARLQPGGDLVDLACGRGGPGLWLARATGAQLVGVDWSTEGVAAARLRAPSFVPDGHARFVVGDLAATGLPDTSADVVICMDAVFFAPDRIAALAEVHRILRPGGRYLFTASERPLTFGRHAIPDWSPLLEEAGLVVESKEAVPHFAEDLARMYALWLDNLDRLRAELGDDVAESMRDEAESMTPTLAGTEHLFITARRPLG